MKQVCEIRELQRPRRGAPPPIVLDQRSAAADQNWPARRRRHNDFGHWKLSSASPNSLL